MPDNETLRTIRKIQCAACQKYFASDSLFDQHRISVVKGAQESKRRCKTTEEMQQSGLVWEWRMVSILRENKRSTEKHEVWYNPDAREKMRLTFRKDEDGEDIE